MGEANCRRIEAVFFGTVRGVVSRGDAVVERCGDKSPFCVFGMLCVVLKADADVGVVALNADG